MLILVGVDYGLAVLLAIDIQGTQMKWSTETSRVMLRISPVFNGGFNMHGEFRGCQLNFVLPLDLAHHYAHHRLTMVSCTSYH